MFRQSNKQGKVDEEGWGFKSDGVAGFVEAQNTRDQREQDLKDQQIEDLHDDPSPNFWSTTKRIDMEMVGTKKNTLVGALLSRDEVIWTSIGSLSIHLDESNNVHPLSIYDNGECIAELKDLDEVHRFLTEDPPPLEVMPEDPNEVLQQVQAPQRLTASLAMKPLHIDGALSETLLVKNPNGLHMRPASDIVDTLSRYESQVAIVYEGVPVNARSISSILLLTIPRGATIEVQAQGSDEEETMHALMEIPSI